MAKNLKGDMGLHEPYECKEKCNMFRKVQNLRLHRLDDLFGIFMAHC